MAKDKKKTIFYCKECGTEFSKWQGQCNGCGAWNSLVEVPASGPHKSGLKGVPKGAGGIRRPDIAGSGGSRKAVRIRDVEASGEERISSGISELDRVLGGGIVPGSLVLVGGDPGIGKSTLLLQMCRSLSYGEPGILYVSGEESRSQIKLRADRLGQFGDQAYLISETSLDQILETIGAEKPKILIIDSIQTIYDEEVSAAPGSITQVKEVTATLLRVAKSEDISIFIVGHVTKEGNVAGPRMLEHMVDTVLYFEGEGSAAYRVLRAVKNRFGSTNEIGVFEMKRQGLREVPNPSAYMMQGKPVGESGSVVTCTMEGSRCLLLEVQALLCKTYFNYPRRTATGTDFNRLNLLIAVVEKRLGVHLSDSDAYINVAGGMRVTEPALDLALIAAIISSQTGKTMDEKTVLFGEVGLVGEVRAVTSAQMRVKEAIQAGYTTCILPYTNQVALEKEEGIPNGSIELVGIRNIRELMGRKEWS